MLTQLDLDKIEEVVDEKIVERTKNLPTKNEFFEKMDEVVTELKKSRENNDLVRHQYDRTNERVDAIDLHLGISTADL